MIRQIIAYIKFWIKSKNQHGIHSPFIYQLVTQCFYDRTTYSSYKKINLYRKSLIKNKTKITINDLGQGSKTIKSNQRSISKIAKTAGTSVSRTKLLYRLIHYFKPNTILELGTSLGIAAHAMHLANPKANITSIEGCKNTHLFAKQQLRAFELKDHIKLLHSHFDNVLNNLGPQTFDFIFVDGNHQKKATLGYFNTLLPHIRNNTILIFDDINWSKTMNEAWQEILKNTNVTVSIDTFFWGIVFFRKEQAKQHFIIRL